MKSVMSVTKTHVSTKTSNFDVEPHFLPKQYLDGGTNGRSVGRECVHAKEVASERHKNLNIAEVA